MRDELKKRPPVSAPGMPRSWSALVAEQARMIEYLTLEDALILIEDLAVGPVRDLGLLDSALHRPGATLWGRDAYATIDEKLRPCSIPWSAIVPWWMETSAWGGWPRWSFWTSTATGSRLPTMMPTSW